MSAKNLIIRGGADFSGVQKELAKSQLQLTAFKSAVSKTVLDIGAIFGSFAVGGLVKDIIQTSAKTETLNVAMNAVAMSTGNSLEALREQKRAVMELGIAEQEATQIMTRFMQAQLNTAQVAKVTRVAQDAGTIAGMNSSEAVEQMVEAIAKLQPRLLTQFGFTASLSDIYAEYAKSVGRTANQLTGVQKKQAMVNYILKEGEKIAGSYEAAMGTFGKKLGSIEKLSMPKKLMQELKTSLGAPLMLPGAGVVLDSLIERLSAIKMWALDNEQTLRIWGETIANAARTTGGAIKAVTKVLTENWGAIKFAGVTLISYTVLSKGAVLATRAFNTALLVLKGELLTQIPILSRVSFAIGTFRLQMALAPATTSVFTATLYGLRAALYAVHAALGPIGWLILGISGAVGVGATLWGKYRSSLASVPQVSTAIGKTADTAASAMEEQAEAIEGAGKAAKGALPGFDEINQLQDKLAGGGGGGGGGSDPSDSFGLGDIGGGGVPALDLEELELVKPSLKGFWEWIKQGFSNAWGAVKNKIQSFGAWVRSWAVPLWEGVKEKWGGFTDWLGDKWGGFKVKSGEIWNGVKSNIQTAWEFLKTNAPIVWDKIKTTIQNGWEVLKTNAPIVWDNIKIGLETRWSALSTSSKNTWENIETFAQASWARLKKDASTVWENIKTTIATKTNNAWAVLKKTWDEAFKYTSKIWADIKSNSGTAWDSIKSALTQKWNDIQISSGSIFTSIKNNIINNWDDIRNRVPGIWGNIKSAMVSPIDSAKSTLLNIIETVKNAFNSMRITIPKPKLPEIKIDWKEVGIGSAKINVPSLKWLALGGIINSPSIVGVGEAGAEAVLPLERNTGWMNDLAAKIAAAIPDPGSGAVYVYIGNEQVDAYIQRSQDRRNIKSNGR